MNLHLLKTDKINEGVTLQLPGSKSESNRFLILQALYPNLRAKHVSDSDDSRVLIKALDAIKKSGKVRVNIGHAGTAMRFLTAFCAALEGVEVILKGSERMHQRPIEVLVEALKELGANIDYLHHHGYPPLLIRGRKLTGRKVSMDAGISSQYLTALLLIAPGLPNGLEIELRTPLTSRSYVEMTVSLLKKIGITTDFKEDTIKVFPQEVIPELTHTIESDWSALSYYYSLLALLPQGRIHFQSFYPNSLQGDAVLPEIYNLLGVETSFEEKTQTLTLTRKTTVLPEDLRLDLNNTPDIAQTVAVTCFGLGLKCELSGLHTLKIKETDRLKAMETELRKMGAMVKATSHSLHLESGNKLIPNVEIDTYDDHRMAMAFAPLAAKTSLVIRNSHVVSKSYPDFWQHFQKLGIQLEVIP